MIRPLTFLSMAAFAASGLHLYQAKAAAEQETHDIGRLRTEAAATLQRADVLKTEYQLENNPERLRDLAARFKQDLTETAPTQFTNLADLERRLPPIGLPPAEPSPQSSPAANVVYDQPPAPHAGAVEPSHDDKPAVVASAKPTAASDGPVSHPAAKAAYSVAANAAAAPGSNYRAASRQSREAASAPPAAYQAQRPYVPPQLAAPTYAPAYAPATPVRAPAPVGSALGMARSIAPTVYQTGYSGGFNGG